MRSTTRKSNRKKYSACKECEYDITGYGVCKSGFDNFYYRASKDNGCKKCSYEIKSKRVRKNGDRK